MSHRSLSQNTYPAIPDAGEYAMVGSSAAGATTINLSMDGVALVVLGVPVPIQAVTSHVAAVWLSDNVPAGAWTATLEKRAAGQDSWSAVATFSISTS